MTVVTERISFTGGHGETLAARLDRPTHTPSAYALFAHCFTCGKDIPAAQRVARTLAEKGIAVLRFDFTGLGHSEGEFANTNFSANIDDLVAAAEHLAANHGAPSLLIGHSLGGAAVIAASPRIPAARAIATVGAPADPEHVRQLFGEQADTIAREGEAQVRLAGRSFRVRKHFLDDLGDHGLERILAASRAALMVFHSPVDEIVGVENASTIFTAAKHPKSFVSLDDADHLLSRRADARYVAEVLGAWAPRYVAEDTAGTDTEADHDAVVVHEAAEGEGLANVVHAEGHRLPADEPKEMGGTETGPSPYGYLLGGLGACTSMTLRMYAQRKSLPLDKVSVRLSHSRIHARDCADCETSSGYVDVLQRRIALSGDLSAEQRERLLEIADKCPVHRTLTGEIRVYSELAAADSAASDAAEAGR